MNLGLPCVRRTLQRTLTIIVCLSLGSAAGCGSGSRVGKLYPVSGKVYLGQVPLTQGGVRFQPDSSRGNSSAAEPVATIGQDGTYTLYTNGKRGAPAGWYKVAVSGGGPIDSTRPFATKSAVPLRFTNPDTAGFSVEVQSGASAGAYDLTVSSR